MKLLIVLQSLALHPSQTEHAMATWASTKIPPHTGKGGMTVTITTRGNIAQEMTLEGIFYILLHFKDVANKKV